MLKAKQRTYPNSEKALGARKLAELAQALDILFLDATALLESQQRGSSAQSPRNRRRRAGHRHTWSQSAISRLILLMRFTRSLSANTAWLGCRLACHWSAPLRSCRTTRGSGRLTSMPGYSALARSSMAGV